MVVCIRQPQRAPQSSTGSRGQSFPYRGLEGRARQRREPAAVEMRDGGDVMGCVAVEMKGAACGATLPAGVAECGDRYKISGDRLAAAPRRAVGR